MHIDVDYPTNLAVGMHPSFLFHFTPVLSSELRETMNEISRNLASALKVYVSSLGADDQDDIEIDLEGGINSDHLDARGPASSPPSSRSPASLPLIAKVAHIGCCEEFCSAVMGLLKRLSGGLP
ncbi:hypothetical protein MSAN_01738800 [Mycena sanguinolenta]|uniref:Uncharacterized protein n=1 Tax=Mycena sanguinolenta TaxID=230812 RepID=A0A8H6XWF6_9AGAR|nr:hypothetical protein MSAN_01738800 [Mycena sanguinolenta]